MIVESEWWVYEIHPTILTTFLTVLKLEGENISTVAGMITKSLWRIPKKLEILVAPERKLDRGVRETFHYKPFDIFLFLYHMHALLTKT